MEALAALNDLQLTCGRTQHAHHFGNWCYGLGGNSELIKIEIDRSSIGWNIGCTVHPLCEPVRLASG